MAAVPLCEAPLADLKKSLLDAYDGVKSSHLSEALAASLGFRTHAALRAVITGPELDRPYVLLDSKRFVERLVEFGYPFDPNDGEYDFELWSMDKGLVSTVPVSAYDIEYRTPRQKAWRNLMVCAVNAGLERKLFTLRPGDNRFSGADGTGSLFDFTLPNGMAARGYVSDAGFHELNVHVAVDPKGDQIRTYNAEFEAGEAVAFGWLERDRGAWLQSSETRFHCRKALVAPLAALKVAPMGYGDRGRVIM